MFGQDMKDLKLECVVEAILMACAEPIELTEVRSAVMKESFRQLNEEELSDLERDSYSRLAKVKVNDIVAAIEKLNAVYDAQKRSFRILNKSVGWKLYTDLKYSGFVGQLFPSQRSKSLSRAAVETLSIIAYRQPITKSAIEATRGVACDAMLQKLINFDLIYIYGRADLPGRPLLYATTKEFTEYFGLKSLEELPDFSELSRQEAGLLKVQEEKEGLQLDLEGMY